MVNKLSQKGYNVELISINGKFAKVKFYLINKNKLFELSVIQKATDSSSGFANGLVSLHTDNSYVEKECLIVSQSEDYITIQIREIKNGNHYKIHIHKENRFDSIVEE